MECIDQWDLQIWWIGGGDFHLRSVMPSGKAEQGFSQLADELLRGFEIGFEVERFYLEPASRSVCFGIETSHQIPPMQDREREIPVNPFFRGGITFDSIFEIE